jgi:DNA replication protein DnaC
MNQNQETQTNTETSSKNKIADFKFVKKPCVYCGTPVETVVFANPEDVVCEMCAKSRAYKKEREDLYVNKVPPGYRHMNFESFKKTADNTTALERAQGFRLGNRGLYLVGNPGVGKTHDALALAVRGLNLG